MLVEDLGAERNSFHCIDGAVGPHFQGNPYMYPKDMLIPHGEMDIELDRTFEDVKRWLEEHNQEGLVFWYGGEPVCKIKRTDFGLPWNGRK